MMDLDRIRQEAGDTRVTRCGDGPRVRNLCDEIERLQAHREAQCRQLREYSASAHDAKEQLKHVKRKQFAAQKIASQLPLTEDGVRIVPGMTVYYLSQLNSITTAFRVYGVERWSCDRYHMLRSYDSSGPGLLYMRKKDGTKVYSTRKACDDACETARAAQ